MLLSTSQLLELLELPELLGLLILLPASHMFHSNAFSRNAVNELPGTCV